ncbi:hypothetical protein [Nocardioides sp. TF02-7]|nr:hypothetical protein [Nocardioides sp. TF02-7]UMG91246.1 hypothetical protein MF408_13785 [Nocardioides sp. TF02-7]
MTVLAPVAPEVVGEQVVAAVESGRRYLLTDPAIAPLARARVDGVLADL